MGKSQRRDAQRAKLTTVLLALKILLRIQLDILERMGSAPN